MRKITKITVEVIIHASMEKVWEFWTKPKHIVNWAFASDDWEAPHAENDVHVGGKFKTVMAAKDKSAGFDFTGVYTNVKSHELIEYDIDYDIKYDIDHGRHVKVQFTQLPDGVRLTEIFEMEKINSEEMQRSGWQAILDNFKKYAESLIINKNTMTKLNIYLNFAGNTEEAFNFYKSVFGGELTPIVRFKDMPMEGVKIPKMDENKVMHVGLLIGKDQMLMATDALESLGQKLVQGNNVYISIHPESKEEADRIFNALSTGGKIEMPIANQSWGDYYGSFKDKFGVQWMVNYSYPKKQ